MKARRAVLVGVSLLALLASAVDAAVLTTRCRPDATGNAKSGATCEIFLSGVIEPGDSAQLERILRAPPGAASLFDGVHLDSPGGDVQEALRLTALVRDAMLYTQNADDLLHVEARAGAKVAGTTCASACFLVLVAGANRYIRVDDAGGRVGFHSPFLDPDVERILPPAQRQARLAALVGQLREFFAAEGVAPPLIDAMIARSHNDMYWLTRSEVLGGIGLAPSWYQTLVRSRCPVPAADASADAFGRALLRQADCIRELRTRAQARLRHTLLGANALVRE